MIDLLGSSLDLLKSVLDDKSSPPADLTRYLSMARDSVLKAISKRTDEVLAIDLIRGKLDVVRQIFTNPLYIELLQYTYGLGSSDAFYEAANNADRYGLKSLLMAMFAGPAFRYRHWRSALTDVALHHEIESYLFASPKIFSTDDDREDFVRYATDLCRALTDSLERGEITFNLPRVGRFLTRWRNGVTYSCEGSTIELARAKGELITHYVDHLAPSRQKNWQPGFNSEGPIRIGLLWSDLARRTENIVGVASCSALRAAGCHVTSFVFSDRGVSGFNRSLTADVRKLSDDVVHLEDDAERGVDVIRNASLDVLIIQNNITWGFSPLIGMCSRRLAPIQAVNFCAVVSTGMPAITTYISGAMSERSGDPQSLYTEKLVLLEGSCLIFDKVDYGASPSVTGKFSRAGLSKAATVFASGANFYKLHPLLTETWIEVIKRVPGSVLVLYPFNPNWDWHYPWSIMAQRLEAQCAQHGVDPARIIVSGAWTDQEPVRELLSHVDIYLDSFPHSGGLSSLDAIVQGIPIVTLAGETQRQNQTVDLLHMLDLSDFVATDRATYIENAVRIADDANLWAAIRLRMLDNWTRGRYFDSDHYGQRLVDVLRREVPERARRSEAVL